MAAIRFTCPSCSRTLEIDESSVEDEVECGACRHVFVPRPTSAAVEPDAEHDTPEERSKRPSRERRDSDRSRERPLSRRRHDDDDDDDDDDEYYPPRRRRFRRDREERGGTSNTATAALVMGLLGLFLSCCPPMGFVFGTVALICAYMSRNDSANSGVSIAGTVLGAIDLTLSVAFLIWYLAQQHGV